MSLPPNRSRDRGRLRADHANAFLTVPEGEIAAPLKIFCKPVTFTVSGLAAFFRPETAKRQLFYSFAGNAVSARDALR